ncbi:autotransporter outer membrane beta-barrel domain-containing protein [Roseospira navarrensis]|uniref:Autotransporter domain-containing protein n=1 Tax=Roseospira navarrensis TaxID=140058 RepID=A0A7X2D2H4_9PROT|nr:autotransporter outer membrane beta-barrel domain-containing protein [Roseospira navarrensis]MQX36294.1 hypothetical protein [Roseospira navarrensis]
MAALAAAAVLTVGAPAFAQEYSVNWLDSYDPDGITSGGIINGKDWYISTGETSQVWSIDGEIIFSGLIGSETDADWERFFNALGIGTATTERAIEDSSETNTRISTRTLVMNIANRAATLARAVRGTSLAQGGGLSDDEGGASLTGLAGGDIGEWAIGRFGIWADGSGTMFSDRTSSDDFWGNQLSFMGGADYRYTDRFMVGAGLGFERVEVDFKSNRTRLVTYINTTLYGAYLVTDSISLNAFGSYAPGLNSMHWAAGDGEGFMSHRFITSGNVAYNNAFDRVTTNAFAGLSYSYETFDSYENNGGTTIEPDDSQLAQVYASGDVGYMFETDGGALEPFVSARLEYDFVSEGNNDRFGSVLGGGVRAIWTEGLFVEAFGNTEVARSDESATSFGLNMRVQF